MADLPWWLLVLGWSGPLLLLALAAWLRRQCIQAWFQDRRCHSCGGWGRLGRLRFDGDGPACHRCMKADAGRGRSA